jgi:predicted metal-dependent phosphoesterase TrpH
MRKVNEPEREVPCFPFFLSDEKEFRLQFSISSETPIDLQMHTTYSDGRWSAEQLFDYLAGEGFGLVAVTDHDRVDTVESILKLGARKQVPVLAAVEISAEFHGKMADVLCFGFDPQDQALRAIADDVRLRQKENAEQVYEELQRRGYRFPHPQDLRVAGDCGIELLKQGAVPDWPSALALVTDAGYLEMKADMKETVLTAHRSGGVALIAHPGRGLYEPQEFTYYTPELLDQVRAEIPLDGIEVYYPTHTPEQVETYLAYAKQHDLLISAGSDSHGPPGRMPIKYRAELCQRLLERVGIRVQ